MDGEVFGLQAVGEWHPDEVAKGQHEPEAIGCDVDSGKDGRLHPEGVEYVDELGDDNHDCNRIS